MLMQSQAVVSSPASFTGRKGFTLIELLVVMGIVVLLVSLGIGASLRAFSWVQKNSTEILLRKVQERMARRYEQIVAEAKAWPTPLSILRLASGDKRRAEVLKVKLIYKWNFPMNYQEVVNNVVESVAYNYAPQGYPFAIALQAQLSSRVGNGATLLDRAPLLAATGMTVGDDLLRQNAAILLAVFESTLGTSVDELVASEIGSFPSGAPGTAYDTNPILIDIWGTPLFFMRYGNLVTGYTSPNASYPFNWLTQVLGPNPPNSATWWTEGTFGGTAWNLPYSNFGCYYPQVMNRAKIAFPLKWQAGQQAAVDPDDPDNTLVAGGPFNPFGWREESNSWWLPPVGPLTPLPNTTNLVATPSGFTLTFGYAMASETNQIRPYAPFVILSAGQDRRFSAFDPANPYAGWDDNLDSYRNSVAVGQQQ